MRIPEPRPPAPSPAAATAAGEVSWDRARRVTVGEVRLAAYELGVGPPVVLLHGFPELAYSFRHQMPALAAAGLRAVAVDLRGFGASDRPPEVADYALPVLVRDVVALIDGLGGSAHLVGHDWGGVVAWAAAAAHPDRVRSLTALNAPHPDAFFQELLARDADDQRRRLWYMLLYQFPGVAEQWLSADDFSRLRARFARSAPGTFSSDDVRVFVDAMRRPGALTAGLNMYRAIVPPERWVAAPPPWGAVKVPVQVVWGMADTVLREGMLARSARLARGPCRVVRLAGVGHYVQQEAPEAVNDALLRFLAGEG